jgi:glycosyltransferase involved in cell wall biosynthesis
MLISIITPTLNAGKTLGETLESIRLQLGHDVEHLLIDAGSTDETLKIAADHPTLTVVSEPDDGIYDGMNKGARMALGEWLLFMQADDWLPEGSLDAFRRMISEYPDTSMICGGAEAVRLSEGRWTCVWKVEQREQKALTIRNIALGEPMINARLIRRDVFWKLGGFSQEYSLASDRDFLLRAAEAGIGQKELTVMTYRYRWHIGSSTMTEGNSLSGKLRKENLDIARNHLGLSDDAGQAEIRKWHSRLSVEGAMNALESANAGEFLDNLRQGCRVEPLWPIQLLAEILKSLPGFLARGGRTKSRQIKETTP